MVTAVGAERGHALSSRRHRSLPHTHLLISLADGGVTLSPTHFRFRVPQLDLIYYL